VVFRGREKTPLLVGGVPTMSRVIFGAAKIGFFKGNSRNGPLVLFPKKCKKLPGAPNYGKPTRVSGLKKWGFSSHNGTPKKSEIWFIKRGSNSRGYNRCPRGFGKGFFK